MIFRDILVIALRGVRAHKLRSALTMVGLVIGVAAVIVLTSFGQGVTGSVNAAVEPVANSITIVPKLSPIPGGPPAKPLTDADARALAKIPQVAELVPQVTGATLGAAGQVSHAVTLQAGTIEFRSATVTGTTADYPSTTVRKLSAGTFFNRAQSNGGARVAVLGSLVAQGLYGPDPRAALGKSFSLGEATFRVVGVMQSYGVVNGSNADDTVYVPVVAARAAVWGYGYGGDELSSIVAKATSTQAVPAAESQISQVLRADHHISNPTYDDFQVQDLGVHVTQMIQVISLITAFVPAIAAIALLVGGIGVLNIMLVSVTDRTREIGTRKAVGASDSAILSQFVTEAMALAGFGGLLGVVLGVGLVLATKVLIPLLAPPTGFLSTFTPVLSIQPVLVAFLISLAIGLVSGSYPAWRAARLNPIEALRYE